MMADTWQDRTSAGRRLRKFEQWLLGEQGDGRTMLFYYPCPGGAEQDFDVKRTQLEQRVGECVGRNGLSLAYAPCEYRGKRAIEVKLEGQALRNYRELDHDRQVNEPQEIFTR